MLKMIGWILFFVAEFAAVSVLFRATYINVKHLPSDILRAYWLLGIIWLLMIFVTGYYAFFQRRKS